MSANSHPWGRPSFFVVCLPVVFLLTGCGNPLKPRIDAETRKVAQAKDRFNQIRKEVEGDLQKEPDLFKAASVTAAWRERFQTDQEKLNDAFTDLEKLNHRDNKLSLFGDVDRLREGAVTDAVAMQTEANRWLDLKHNAPQHLKHMQADYDKVHSADVSKVSEVIEKAEQDWPAKKLDLDARLAGLKSEQPAAEAAWKDAQAANAKPDYAALMSDERKLDTLAAEPDLDRKLAGQLYSSYDKVLVDLEEPRGNDLTAREKVKTIRTQITDVQNHQNQTNTDEKWVDIPESQYASLQNDIGMTIEHKPAGAYDSEVQTVPQPPGFAYMAPPGQRNQYGYWEQRNGSSVWTWLPEYLLLREVLWNHHYMPVPSYEYDGYWSARRSGTTYYGGGYSGGGYSGPSTQAPPAPKYGTHGTFTEHSYANSRYMNKGGTFGGSQYKSQGGSGYRSSGYASGQSAAPPPSASSSDHGHQFGRSPGSGSSGKRFGGSSGGSHSAPSGRRFGGGGRRR
jgi:hypothetical protein